MVVKTATKIYYEGEGDVVHVQAIGYRIEDRFFVRYVGFGPNVCPACGGYKDHPCRGHAFIEVDGQKFYESNAKWDLYTIEEGVEIYIGSIQRSIEDALKEGIELASSLPDVFVVKK